MSKTIHNGQGVGAALAAVATTPARTRRLKPPLRLAMCAAGLLLAGCAAVGPNFQSPHPDMPAGWDATRAVVATQPSVPTTAPAELTAWWTSFKDPTLDSLITRAVATNLDLKVAQSRIRQARASAGIAGAGAFPSVNSSASYARTHNGGGSSGNSSDQDFFHAGFDASWEIDVFGGVRRNIEAANANVQFAIEDSRDVMVSLLSEVAGDYVQLRAFQQQIVIAKRNLDVQQKSLDVTRRRAAGGFVTGLDVATAEAQVATTAALIPSFESQERQTIYALSVLLGMPPTSLVDELSQRAPIPTTPPAVPVGLPSDLLRRRPDIRRAEAEIHAATAKIGVATADLFPKFSLNGSLGVSSNQLKNLLSANNLLWSIGPSVSWNVFDAGAIRWNIEVQKALQEQSMLQYQKTVLTALQDVESALEAYSKEQAHHKSLEAAQKANQRAVDLATQLYDQGRTNFLNVLDAQRSLFVSEAALVQSDQTVSLNLVALYKALGGGWEEK